MFRIALVLFLIGGVALVFQGFAYSASAGSIRTCAPHSPSETPVVAAQTIHLTVIVQDFADNAAAGSQPLIYPSLLFRGA
ncbi:hypothetical protein ACFWCA_19395 [Streptomyces phaeochromogenes]|uniref:hypothetical protein n=1 Tax=Streptomyces phaeochromogenes TaxID=1923 RepID=UPI0036B8F057